MIRVNLLPAELERAKRSALIPAAHRVMVAGSLILVATALIIGWWSRSLRLESARVDEDIARADVAMQQLRTLIAQMRQLETSKAALQRRVNLIEQLRRGQSVPVHLVDQLSRSLPGSLWLTEVSQKGQEFTVAGMTTSLTAVSDLIANLDASPWFTPPIELVDSQVDTSQKAIEPIIRFSIRVRFTDRQPRPESPATGAANGAPPAAGGAGS